jgi:hypothetical protein
VVFQAKRAPINGLAGAAMAKQLATPPAVVPAAPQRKGLAAASAALACRVWDPVLRGLLHKNKLHAGSWKQRVFRAFFFFFFFFFLSR